MSVTLKDIARITGYSVKTVSAVLNDAPSCYASQKTRETIVRVSKEMSYTPNRNAQALRAQKTKVIGLVIGVFNRLNLIRQISVIEKAVRSAGRVVSISTANHNTDLEMEVARELAAHRVEGALFFTDFRFFNTPPAMTYLKSQDIPVVSLDRAVDAEIDQVNIDRDKGLEMALKFLMDKGAERIVFNTAKEKFPIGGRYQEVIEDFCKKNGLDSDIVISVEQVDDAQDLTVSQKGFENWLASDEKDINTAVIGVSDFLAAGASRACKAAGLDWQIMGIANHDVSSMVEQPFSSVSLKPEETAAKALELLLERIESPDTAPQIITVEPELIIR
jgi:DNA-binding LacI/PurR family transcriptional regulator